MPGGCNAVAVRHRRGKYQIKVRPHYAKSGINKHVAGHKIATFTSRPNGRLLNLVDKIVHYIYWFVGGDVTFRLFMSCNGQCIKICYRNKKGSFIMPDVDIVRVCAVRYAARELALMFNRDIKQEVISY